MHALKPKRVLTGATKPRGQGLPPRTAAYVSISESFRYTVPFRPMHASICSFVMGDASRDLLPSGAACWTAFVGGRKGLRENHSAVGSLFDCCSRSSYSGTSFSDFGRGNLKLKHLLARAVWRGHKNITINITPRKAASRPEMRTSVALRAIGSIFE